MPNPGDPQSLNRYSYVLNNPLRYSDPTGHAQQDMGGGVETGVAIAAGYALASQAGQALNVAMADAQAFVQSLGQQLNNLIPAVTDRFVNPGQASTGASSNTSGQYDSSQFNLDPGQFDPNRNRPQDVGQEAHRQFRQQFRERMAQQGREEGTGDYLTERGIRDAQGNVVRNAQGQYGKPDAVDYVNHIIYDLKPWQEGGERAILLEYQSQFDLYVKLYELAYGVTPTIRIVTYAGP